MTKHVVSKSLIKLEPEEVEFSLLKYGIDESYESTIEQDESIQKDTTYYQLIKHLKQKIEKLENKLIIVSYRYKVRHAKEKLIRNKQAKKIKNLTEENSELNKKLSRLNDITECFDKLYFNLKNLNANELNSNNGSTSNKSVNSVHNNVKVVDFN